ncbi:putative speedy protein E7 [Lepus europaeus]|uniref:putative speedy protein E7 n=1 Tax=Lepus europaeus TaxID=9983 RepID=UPI002B45C9F7|nr:putative speedy protein E7 [Lepus europaeus]
MEDTRPVSTGVSSREHDALREAPEGSLCPGSRDPQDSSPLASSSASSVAEPEQESREKRDRKTRKSAGAQPGACPRSYPGFLVRTRRGGDGPVTTLHHHKARPGLSTSCQRKARDLPAGSASYSRGPCVPSDSAALDAVSELKSWRKRGQRKNIWTVNHVEGTKLRMNKRRRPSYRPEDQEAFYRLLEDPVIQSFLEADIFLKVSDKYLLAMVVEYFGRVGLPGHLYNRIHFFLALYIASDMEEDNPTSKRSIFQFLLGKEHWPDLYKEFLKLKVEFFHAMDHRAWVTPELCEEIQAQNPHHWVWSRERQCAP